MEELSFPADQGISPIAVSEPFELFSKEAVKYMRNEVLSDEVWDNCRFSSSIAACQLRGMSPKYVFLTLIPFGMHRDIMHVTQIRLESCLDRTPPPAAHGK